jgi:hypothetical protein
MEGMTLTQAVGLGSDRSPLWGLRQIQMRALCLHVVENGHAAIKGDENVETPAAGLKPRPSKGHLKLRLLNRPSTRKA